ncbi:CCR4-NOT transcription complex subunit 4-like [Pollicipes pollicipes]|uniref:CCR4-NOT transcription complex subunit 4-like n=1 Tax=Pollicipes pollicipes TaxID=41117 RepID=UPI001885719B|nr:CCR4-NOT transcription complex subunit 4-like [Pollicipes pollicipes]
MAYDMDDQAECPLCMEQFEMDDLSFFPCTCGYQICRFCWHRIRTDENGLCPACRKPYSENPADFKPLTAEELQKIKAEKKQKDLQKKQKMSENRKHLANVRVVQKNLVFVVGLSPRLADPDVLKRHEYFGKFGKIHKVVINHSTQYAGSQCRGLSQGPSASAYVTYYRSEDALRAIEAVNNVTVENRTLKASLGTTKYCSHFMKNQPCPKTDCMYLHEPGDEAASFTKEAMQQGKHQEYEKKLHDQLYQQHQNQINRAKDRRSHQSQSESGSVPIPPGSERVSSAENSPPDGGSAGSAGSSGGGGGGGGSPSVVVASNHSDDENSAGSRERQTDSSRSTPLSQSAPPLQPPPGLSHPTPALTPASSSGSGEWLLPARAADATVAALLSQPTPPPEEDDCPLDGADDDLDFDPFEETKKGLGALLEREREQQAQLQQQQQHQQQQRHHHHQQQQHLLRLGGGLLPHSQSQSLAAASFNVPGGAAPRVRPPPPGFSGPSGLGLGLGCAPQQPSPDLCGSKMLPFLNNSAMNGMNGLNGLSRLPPGRPRALSPPDSLFSDLSSMMMHGQSKPPPPPPLQAACHDALKGLNISFSSAQPATAPPPGAARFGAQPGRHAVPHGLVQHGAAPRFMAQPHKTSSAGWSGGSDWTAMDPAIVSSGQLAAPRSDSPPHWLRSLEQLTETGPMYPPPAPRPAAAPALWTSTPPPGFNPALGRATADNL